MTTEETVPGSGAPSTRPRVDAARLWAGGLAAAVVAALIGLVGVLVVRATLRIAMFAPQSANATLGGSATVMLCAVAAGSALAATALVHALLRAAPQPMSYFGWIVGLVTAAAVTLPFLSREPLPLDLAEAAIRAVIGMAIGTLVSAAARTATRCPPRRPIEPDIG